MIKKDSSYPDLITGYSILTSEVDVCSVCRGIGSHESKTTGTLMIERTSYRPKKSKR